MVGFEGEAAQRRRAPETARTGSQAIDRADRWLRVCISWQRCDSAMPLCSPDRLLSSVELSPVPGDGNSLEPGERAEGAEQRESYI